MCDVCVRSGGRERKADEIQPYDVRGRSVGVGETRPTRLAAREPKIKFKMHHVKPYRIYKYMYGMVWYTKTQDL